MPWNQALYVLLGLLGLIVIATAVLKFVESWRAVFGRKPSYESEFATRADLKEQDTITRLEIQKLETKLTESFDTISGRHHRDMGELHEKINAVAEDTAFIRGQLAKRTL